MNNVLVIGVDASIPWDWDQPDAFERANDIRSTYHVIRKMSYEDRLKLLDAVSKAWWNQNGAS